MMILGSVSYPLVLVYITQDMVSAYRMHLYLVEFLICQLTRLVDNILRDTNLSYIMQQSGIINDLLLFF